MDFLSSYALGFVAWLKHHPNLAGLITFLISFSESLAIVGSIIPGSITMTAIGILIGSGIIPCYSTFVWAIIGAILGDYVSFYIGYVFHQQIISRWPFNRYPNLMANGKSFFDQHGAKSVFFGRFLGPLRSIIPVIAGMMQMPQRLFVVANVFSAILWSIAYIFPGVLIGSAASELGSIMATRIFLFTLAIIALCWVIYYLLKCAMRFFKEQIKQLRLFLQQKLFALSEGYPNLRSVLVLSTRYRSHLWLIFLIGFFCWYSFDRANYGVVTQWDKPLFHLLQSLHTTLVSGFFMVITASAWKYNVMLIAALISIYLVIKDDYRDAGLLISSLVITAISVYGLKHGFAIPRPPGSNNPALSYPSGHTALSMATYGTLVTIWRRHLKPTQQSWLYKPVVIYFALIGLSRLYLGQHWLSDVIGAMLLAGIVTSLLRLIFKPRDNSVVQPVPLIVVSLTSMIFVVGFDIVLHFNTLFHKDLHPKPTIAGIYYDQWWGNPRSLPMLRSDRFGHPTTLLNVQWAMQEAALVNFLEQNGWTLINHQPFTKRIHHAFFDSKQPIALFQKLYHNRPPVIIALKQAYILRLWHADYQFIDNHTPLWIGTLSPLADEKKKQKIKHNNATLLKKSDLKIIVAEGIHFNINLDHNAQIIQLHATALP